MNAPGKSTPATLLHWTAGFLEGEGSFKGFGSKNATTPVIAVVQVQREPLDRLVRAFGGRIYHRPARKPTHQPASYWHLTGRHAIGLMMTVYPLMSPRRQAQIREVLARWRCRRADRRFDATCRWGHPLIARARGRGCRECSAAASRRSYVKTRARA